MMPITWPCKSRRISLCPRENTSSVWEPKLMIPKVTLDTLSLERLVTLETFIVNFQEEGEQIIDQQNAKGKDLDEVFQSHREEKMTTEDTIEELEPEQDEEVSICAPPFDEAIHEPFPPTQEEENEVSHFPFQDLDNALFYDSEKEEIMESSGKVDLAVQLKMWGQFMRMKQ
jgi:hypothetical protein